MYSKDYLLHQKNLGNSTFSTTSYVTIDSDGDFMIPMVTSDKVNLGPGNRMLAKTPFSLLGEIDLKRRFKIYKTQHF